MRISVLCVFIIVAQSCYRYIHRSFNPISDLWSSYFFMHVLFQGGNYRRRRRMKRPFRTLPSLGSRAAAAAAYISHHHQHHPSVVSHQHGGSAGTIAAAPNATFIHGYTTTPVVPTSPSGGKHRYPSSAAAAAAFNFMHPSFSPHFNAPNPPSAGTAAAAVLSSSQFSPHSAAAVSNAAAMSAHHAAAAAIHNFPTTPKGIPMYDATGSFNTFTAAAMLSQNGFHPSMHSSMYPGTAAAAANYFPGVAAAGAVSPTSPNMSHKMYYHAAGGGAGHGMYQHAMSKYMDENLAYNHFYPGACTNGPNNNPANVAFMQNSHNSPNTAGAASAVFIKHE